MREGPGSTVSAENRRLAAIMFTDIVGFSRQMGADEGRTLRLLAVHNRVVQQAVVGQKGTIIKTVGDAFLVDFPSVVLAVQCAQAIQAQFQAHNAEIEGAEQIHVRIGIHLGDIVQQDSDVFGDGVNIAARLQELAAPDTTCVSDVVYRDVAQKVPLGTVVSLGRPHLKNITQRFQVYALLPEPSKGIRQALRIQRLKLARWVRPAHLIIVAGLVLVTVTFIAVRSFFLPPPSTQPLAPSTQAAPAALPLPDKPSIIVLPFANMGEDPKQEYFSDGITEDITTSLAQISTLFVIARNSAFTYKGKAVKVQDVSREMGVQYVLEGSVRRADEQVRITAQLIDGLTGAHLWAERFDRPLRDIFAVQDEVVQKIVTTLKLQLTLWEQGALVRKSTDNLEAYDYFLHGLGYVYRVTKEANAQARQMYEKAIERDPDYAAAYAGVGWTYMFDLLFQWSQDPHALERAFSMAQKAVALDDSLPTAHTVLAQVYLWKRRNAEAIAEAERAVTVAPNSAEGAVMLAAVLSLTDRPEEAIGIMEKAMRLNPRYPFFYLGTLGEAYRLARQYEKAIPILKSALARNPNWLPAHADLAIAYSEVGQEAEAQAEVAAILRISPNYSLQLARQTWPVKDPAVLERDLAALRKAGLK